MGHPLPWPLGVYKLYFNVTSTDNNTTPFNSKSWPGAEDNGTLTFQVIAPPANNTPDTNGNIQIVHPLPEQMCPCM
jgi:hypothetical protein